MREKEFPLGWDEERVKRVILHYEQQSDEEAIAEDKAAFEESANTRKRAARFTAGRKGTDITPKNNDHSNN